MAETILSKLLKWPPKNRGYFFGVENSSHQLNYQSCLWIEPPTQEYCSHNYLGASTSTSLLDNYRVESKAFRLIDDQALTSNLDSLALQRKVVSPSLFDIVPPRMKPPQATRQATSLLEQSFALSNSRIGRFGDYFFLSVSWIWIYLPSTVFRNYHNLSLFKKQVCHHLTG